NLQTNKKNKTHNIYYSYFINEGMLGRFSVPTTFPLDILEPSEIQKNTITYFGCYYNTLTYENLGYLAINVRKNSLFSDISSLCDNTFDTTCIIDEKNNIIYQNGSDFPLEIANNLDSYTSYEKPIKIGGLSYLLYSKEVETYPRWRVIGLLNYQQVTDKITDLYYIVLLISVILLILVIFISFYISQHITVPIRTISCAMGILGEGKYPEKAAVTTHDELYDLVTGFNNMVDNIKRLNTELITKQEEQKKYEVAIVKSQLDLLQSQINPHFIHNTLNTMNYMAQKAGAAELAQTITSFNALLRTSISRGNHLTTVAEEVENLYNYMNIQKQRYDIPLEFICSVPEEIRFGLVPKLILQPLVENALFHGIAPMRGGTITVSFLLEDSDLHIYVSDTGAGMSDEQLKLMLSGSMPNPKGYNNIGLSNVSERLILNYGTESQLKISSTLRQGTKISFKIPFVQ
ncbi:MAG: integral rane sensor signal transduction histidine kinase, partial [Clostridia bacterium]|nr:integral rane sensor signal transduction histidine kinase [Clostridia bacterium]